MSSFTPITSFFTDPNVNITKKWAYIIISILVILTIDNYIGFSSYLQTNFKTSEIQSMNDLLKNDNLSEDDRTKILKMQSEILNRKSLAHKVFNFITDINFNKDLRIGKNSKISNIDFILSNTIIYLVFLLIGILLTIKQVLTADKDKLVKFSSRFIEVFSVFMFCYVHLILMDSIFPNGFVQSSVGNYVIFIIIQILSIVIMLWMYGVFDNETNNLEEEVKTKQE